MRKTAKNKNALQLYTFVHIFPGAYCLQTEKYGMLRILLIMGKLGKTQEFEILSGNVLDAVFCLGVALQQMA